MHNSMKGNAFFFSYVGRQPLFETCPDKIFLSQWKSQKEPGSTQGWELGMAGGQGVGMMALNHLPASWSLEIMGTFRREKKIK